MFAAGTDRTDEVLGFPDDIGRVEARHNLWPQPLPEHDRGKMARHELTTAA
jgi:hypothetical protein